MTLLRPQPAFARPRPCTTPFAHFRHRTVEQVDADQEAEAFAGFPTFLRRMILDAERQP